MRFLFFIIPFALMNGQITVSPQSPSVDSGKTVTLTSNTPVAWSLKGVGSLSNITSTSATFTAPSGVPAKNQMLGCPVGPNDTIFNTRVDSLPVNSRSSSWIAGSAASSTVFEVDNWGISIADATTPTRTMRTYYSDSTIPNFVMPAAGPNLKRQGGAYVGMFATSTPADHHVMTVRHTDCTFYESYDDYLNGVTRACRDGSAGCNVESAITYSSTSYAVPGPDGGTNAASMPLAPTIWQLSEIEGGSINHATTFTTNVASVLFNSFVWPAAASAGGCVAATCPNAMPMGTRLRLRSSFNQAAVCNSGITRQDAACNTMLTALKQYGMILSDTGLSNAVQLLSEVTEDPVVTAAVQRLVGAKIAFTNFEAVDESSLEVSATSYQVCPLATVCMNGANLYEAPSYQAVVTATGLTGSSVSIPVAIQPVAIGLGVPPVIAIATGNFSYQIPAWVNGTADQGVSWSLLSGVGSVTVGGVYTPPMSTSAAGITDSAVLQGVSHADSAATVTLRLNVIQTASNGAIRVDTGAATSTTDSNGNIWAADIGIEGGASPTPTDYPHWNRTNPAALLAYESVQDGDDLGNTIIVPNGTYNLHLLFGLVADGACNSTCTTWITPTGARNQYDYTPYVLEAQGLVQNSAFDFGAPNYLYQTPAGAYIPAVVTNNLLQVYVRSVMSDLPPYNPPRTAKRSLLNGLEIVPGASAAVVAPSWTINTAGQTSIALGQTLRPFTLTASGGAPNDPTWSILSGPAGATLSGSTLSLAATASPNSQPIAVRASDGIYSASVSIATPAKPTNAFAYKRILTIPHTAVGPADLASFPVLVSITDPKLASIANGGHVSNANGYDLVFAGDAAGSNILSFEVESYNALTGTIVAHVTVLTVSHSADTVFYLLYGNSTITATQAKANWVWDSNFTGVYHFHGPPLQVTDSSWHQDNALNFSLTYSANGEIAGAAATTNTSANLPAQVLDQPKGTFEAWVSTTQPQSSNSSWVIASQAGSTSRDYFRIGWNGTDSKFEAVWSSNTAGSSSLGLSSSKANFSLHPWNHVAYTWDSSAGSQNLYINGVLQGTVSGPIPVLSSSKAVVLGAYLSPFVSNLQGLVDEVRFSNIVRPSNWIAAAYKNQSAPASFVTIGSEQSNN